MLDLCCCIDFSLFAGSRASHCGGLSFCEAQSPGYSGFRSCGAWAPDELRSCGSQAPEHRLNRCGAWAELLCGMWDLPGPGVESVSLALAGGGEAPIFHILHQFLALFLFYNFLIGFI